MERVTITVEHGVAEVRLARPDKINACDPAMLEALCGAISRIAAMRAMRAVRAVVLSGEGRGFCVGIDLDTLSGPGAPRDLRRRTHGPANLFQQAAWGWRTLPQPVIAAVHGFAYGAGLQIALGADIRIATPDAQLSLMEARWGLVPDMGAFALLRGLARDDVARELVYTARVFSGAEAVGLGLVTRTAADPRAEAMALARTIAARSPAAIRAAKRSFAVAGGADEATTLITESVEQEALLASAGHAETLAAAREGRAPVFGDEG